MPKIKLFLIIIFWSLFQPNAHPLGRDTSIGIEYSRSVCVDLTNSVQFYDFIKPLRCKRGLWGIFFEVTTSFGVWGDICRRNPIIKVLTRYLRNIEPKQVTHLARNNGVKGRRLMSCCRFKGAVQNNDDFLIN